MKAKTVKSWLWIIACIAMLLPLSAAAQTGAQNSDPELSKYNNTINFPKPPRIEFKELGARSIISSPERKFVADNDVIITFDVTIGADGRVYYVRPHSCAAQFNEYRKGGINYLYATRFSPLSNAQDQRVTAVFTFPGVEFPKPQE